MNMQTFLSISGLMLLSACAAVPNAKKDIQAIKLPEKWQQAHDFPTQQKTNKTAWWQEIEDDLLKQYLTQAQENNLDIAAAAYRFRQHILASDLTLADRLPKLSAGAAASSSKLLEGGSSTRRYSSNASLSWQVDLFATLAKTQDVKNWLAHASAEDLVHLQNSIIGQTAEQYWQLAGINQQLKLVEYEVTSAQKILQMMQVRYRVGDVAKMQLLESEQHLRAQERIYDNLLHRRTQVRHALSLLLGEVPTESTLPEPFRLPESQLPNLPANMPAQLLDRRADVSAARWRLMADMGNVDIAVRRFFPQLNLNISASASGSRLAQIAQNPMGALGLDVLLPFLNWPTNQLNLKSSELQYQENLLNFKKTVYRALVEVENAFSQRALLQKEAKKTQADFQAALALAQMHKVRHQYGESSLEDYLRTETQRISAEKAVIENRLARYQNFLALQLALGA